jgi:hypothetical protein
MLTTDLNISDLEQRRIARAREINPDYVPPKRKRRGRKPTRKGRPRRECRVIDGVEHYACIDCERWLPKSSYYKHADPASVCGILSVCKECDMIRRGVTRRRAASKRKALLKGGER